MKTNRGYTASELLFAIGGLASVAMTCVLVYATIHFLMKFW
jgi:hypothetical protein